MVQKRWYCLEVFVVIPMTILIVPSLLYWIRKDFDDISRMTFLIGIIVIGASQLPWGNPSWKQVLWMSALKSLVFILSVPLGFRLIPGALFGFQVPAFPVKFLVICFLLFWLMSFIMAVWVFRHKRETLPA